MRKINKEGQHKTPVFSENFFNKKNFNLIIGPNGEKYLVEKHIDLDKVFTTDHRKSKYVYSSYLADQICEAVACGESLRSICRQDCFPPYSVIAKWRREHKSFSEALELAYQDRAETFRDELQQLLLSIDDKNTKSSKLKADILKSLASYDNASRYGKSQSQKSTINSIGCSIIYPIDKTKPVSLPEGIDVRELTNNPEVIAETLKHQKGVS